MTILDLNKKGAKVGLIRLSRVGLGQPSDYFLIPNQVLLAGASS
jgi:hypothetical protein